MPNPHFPLNTWVGPYSSLPRHMDMRTLGYVFVDVIGSLSTRTDWGSAQWIKVFDLGYPGAPQLLQIFIGPKRTSGQLSKASGSNTTMTLTPSVPDVAISSNSMDVTVVFLGTQIAQRTILYLFFDVLKAVFQDDRNLPCPRSGGGSIIAPDRRALLQVEFMNTRPSGQVYLMEEFAGGLMEVLFDLASRKRWESATASVRIDGLLFLTVTLASFPSGSDDLDEGRNQTATA